MSTSKVKVLLQFDDHWFRNDESTIHTCSSFFKCVSRVYYGFPKQIFLDNSGQNLLGTHTSHKFTVGQVFLFITALKPKTDKS